MIKSKKTTGFTLIELLITISIILLMTGVGIAGFINFNDKQQVQTTVSEVKDSMRSAQVKARAGEGADACSAVLTKLKGYKVELLNATTVVLNRVCVHPVTGVETDVERSRIVLQNVDLVMTPVTFLALRGGVDTGGSDVLITISGKYATDTIYTFQVLQTGEITEGAFQ